MHRCNAVLQVGVVSGEKPLALYTTVGEEGRGGSDGERVATMMTMKTHMVNI